VLLEAAFETEATPTWAPENKRETQADWQAVDRALRIIAQRRAALDADEARWLREAEVLQIWRPLGMVSALDDLERVLGYGPRVAQERLRVARALGTLPQLTAALAHSELPFSAVRELTRVATPATEAAWCEAATGKNLRQIEELVADHRPGDYPEDPPDPEARVRVVRFEFSAETLPAGLAGRRGREDRDRPRRGRARHVRCPAHRIDRWRHARARSPGRSAERRARRVASRRRPLPRARLPVRTRARAPSPDSPHRRR
jgi:hypothetical protein